MDEFTAESMRAKMAQARAGVLDADAVARYINGCAGVGYDNAYLAASRLPPGVRAELEAAGFKVIVTRWAVIVRW